MNTQAVPAPKSKIPGANILLMGGTGTGKTSSLRTLLEAEVTPFILFTEPGMETMSDTGRGDRLSSLLLENQHPYHWQYIPPVVSDWGALLKMGQTVNQLSYEALCKMTDANKSKYGQLLQVIQASNNFTCEECGESFGDVSTWNTSRAFCVDSLTGLSKMAMRLVIGGKVAKAPPDYGVAQDMLMKLIDAWTTKLRCWFIMTAHEAMERDEALGTIKRMPNTVGRALAPELPNFFSDVIECVRVGTEFSWDTAATQADTKARNVPVASKIPPSFAPLVESWKKKGGILE